MDKKDFESLLNKYPDCVSDGKKLKAFLKDLYPDVPKAIVNTLTIMADDGIIFEMQKVGQTPLASARLQKKLEDDYGLSQKIIAECFSLIIYDSAKQTKTTISVCAHEKNTSFIDTQPTFSLKKEEPQKLDVLQPEYDPKDFEIENGTLTKYKGSSSVVVIPDNVTSIGRYAFYGCEGLTSITIPNSVTSIGAYVFYGCAGLTSVTIGNGVTSIGGSAFRGCSGLTNITIPDSVTKIGGGAFCGCSGLTSITIPNSVTSIGDDAFYGCSKLQGIYITDIAAWCNISGVGNLMSYYGANNKNLYLNNELATSITIPNRVKTIPSYAFYSCSGLTSVTIPDSVTSIGDDAFSGCERLTSITIPDSVTSIGSWAFCNCSSLTSVMIPDSVTSIGGSAFRGCTGLTSITIPDSVTSIGSQAFYNCIGLASVTIPDSVTSIGSQAFRNCTGLASVTIPNSVTSIGDDAFSGCRNLTINCEAERKPIGWSNCWNQEHSPVKWGKYNQNMFNIKEGNLIKYRGNEKDVIIPGCVNSIQDKAFYGCNLVENVTISNNVKNIGSDAFSGCTALTSITIPDSVESIGWWAFHGCRKLTIYCEAESKPIGWSSYWNPEHRPVVWGVKK